MYFVKASDVNQIIRDEGSTVVHCQIKDRPHCPTGSGLELFPFINFLGLICLSESSVALQSEQVEDVTEKQLASSSSLMLTGMTTNNLLSCGEICLPMVHF